MIDKRVGKRIKQRREQLGLTQEQFAEKLGVATNYISTIERGASFPRYEKLVAIINALETSADAIFCDVVTHSLEKDCALNRTVFLFSTNFSTFRLSLMILCISDIY